MKADIFDKIINEIENHERVKNNGDFSFMAGIDLCLEILNREKFSSLKQELEKEE